MSIHAKAWQVGRFRNETIAKPLATIMKKTILFISILLILSCKSEKKENTSKINNTELHLIEFLDKRIDFPKNYRKTSLEEISKSFEQNSAPNGFEESYVNGLRNLLNMNAKFEIFSEKENDMNSIWFLLGEYIPLDKSIVNPYVNMMETQLLTQTEKYGIEYKRLESKFLTNMNTKTIKIKYEQILNGNKRYLTQYLISYKLKTFSIYVSNEKNIDYQFITKNFGTY